MNKFEALFNSDMSTKQLSRLFWQLSDTVKRGTNEETDLMDAFEKARNTATDREFAKAKEIEEKSRTATMDCVFCGRV